MFGSRVVRTHVGDFKITVNDHINYETMEKIGITIGVGGMKDTCVFIVVPNDQNTAKLHNVRIRGLTCEVNGKIIRGDKTIHMVNLAFTILKEEAPNVKYVYLDDSSEFPCTTDNGKFIGVSLALYELAFHRSTWYERHFNSTLKNETLKQLYTKDGFTNLKNPVFNFKHAKLNEELMPIYERTTTWKEFFDELYRMDGKCKLLIPWYKEALKNIMGGVSFDNQDWIIDLNNPKIQSIVYARLPIHGGSQRRTRKNMKNIYSTYDYIDDVSLLDPANGSAKS